MKTSRSSNAIAIVLLVLAAFGLTWQPAKDLSDIPEGTYGVVRWSETRVLLQDGVKVIPVNTDRHWTFVSTDGPTKAVVEQENGKKAIRVFLSAKLDMSEADIRATLSPKGSIVATTPR